jgi:basic membrane protein A
MSNRKIEKVVVGNIHGSDASAGFERGWVEMIDLNLQVAAEGTQEAMNSAIEEFKKGNGNIVFKGDYIGVDPDNPSNTIDLTEGYVENAHTSYPLFDYVLKDVITIEE